MPVTGFLVGFVNIRKYYVHYAPLEGFAYLNQATQISCWALIGTCFYVTIEVYSGCSLKHLSPVMLLFIMGIVADPYITEKGC